MAESNRAPPDKVSDQHWQAVAEILPAGADHARWRNDLERIAHDTSTPLQRAKECEERARRNRQSLALSAKGSALAAELTQQIRHDDEQARLFREIARQRQPYRFLRQYEILALWESAGGDLRISTPRKPKEEACWPDPEGPVIAYFRAASGAVFGRTPSASQAKQVLRRYRHLKHGAASLAGAGKLTIADELVWIIPPKV